MLALERATILKREAYIVLQLVELNDILGPYSQIFQTGSYFLDVMVYPDIDLYIMKVSLEELFTIGAKFAESILVSQVVFERSDDPILMPDGLYLKLRVNYGDWGRPWKIDIWSLDEYTINKKVEVMQHFKDKLTPFLREQIIRYKLSVMTSQKRTPMYSGYYIYKAFIDEGLVDFHNVSRYIRSHGIQVEGDV